MVALRTSRGATNLQAALQTEPSSPRRHVDCLCFVCSGHGSRVAHTHFFPRDFRTNTHLAKCVQLQPLRLRWLRPGIWKRSWSPLWTRFLKRQSATSWTRWTGPCRSTREQYKGSSLKTRAWSGCFLHRRAQSLHLQVRWPAGTHDLWVKAWRADVNNAGD